MRGLFCYVRKDRIDAGIRVKNVFDARDVVTYHFIAGFLVSGSIDRGLFRR